MTAAPQRSSLQVGNLVVLEIGLALALLLLAVDAGLWGVALIVALITVPLAFGRWHGRTVLRWIQICGRYLTRSSSRSLPLRDPSGTAGDPRVALLSLLVPNLIVSHSAERPREPVGFAWHQGTWTAVLEIDATPSMIAPLGAAAGLPLGALASCLEDRGVVLDAISVIWHCYPGNAALPPSSPALRSYLEVLGPLPAAARRTTWVAVRLDPHRCPAAVAERGGGVTGCHRALSAALARVRATLESERTQAQAQIALLQEAKTELSNQFKALAAEILEEKSKRFAEHNALTIGQIMDPLRERMTEFKAKVEEIHARDLEQQAALRAELAHLKDLNRQITEEALGLAVALKGQSKKQGNWGELVLANVLDRAGLVEGKDYRREVSFDTEEGRRRPDVVLSLPQNKHLVIDAKVSLNAYQAAFEADDEDERRRQLEQHAKSMRGHVQTLGAKGYQSQFEEAPDYVVMFVPGEHFVAAALEADPELWDFAFEKRVLLATPTNLVAICRTVAQVWRQDSLAREAQEIGRMGAELYERLRVAADHLKRVGGGLETAVNNYNKFVGSFERNVLSSGKRLAEKGVDIGRAEIPEVPLVESAPRYTGDDTEDGAAVRLVGGKDQEEAGEAG